MPFGCSEPTVSSRGLGHAGEPRELAQRHARPLLPRRPALDAAERERVRGLRQREQVLARELDLAGAPAAPARAGTPAPVIVRRDAGAGRGLVHREAAVAPRGEEGDPAQRAADRLARRWRRAAPPSRRRARRAAPRRLIAGGSGATATSGESRGSGPRSERSADRELDDEVHAERGDEDHRGVVVRLDEVEVEDVPVLDVRDPGREQEDRARDEQADRRALERLRRRSSPAARRTAAGSPTRASRAATARRRARR